MPLDRLAPALLGALALALLPACSTSERLSTPIEPALSADTRDLAVEIENFHGDVTLIVDPDVSEATVTTRIKGSDDLELSEEELIAAVWVEATPVPGPTGETLLVRSGTDIEDEYLVRTDLEVTVPNVDGVKVRGRGGQVTLVRVAGPIDVAYSAFRDHQGSVVVRTDRPITEPVSILTERGNIMVQVGAEARGTVELYSGSSKPELSSRVGRVARLATDGDSVTAILNGGTNPIRLRAQEGRVRMMVIENPTTYINTLR